MRVERFAARCSLCGTLYTARSWYWLESLGLERCGEGSMTSVEVRQCAVPGCWRGPADAALPLASFEAEGKSCAILIRGDQTSRAVEKAVNEAAQEALVHLSRKLLN